MAASVKTPTTASKEPKRACRNYARNGTCSYGDACKFLHTTTGAAKKEKKAESKQGDVVKKFCKIHKSNTHNTLDCDVYIAHKAEKKARQQAASAMMFGHRDFYSLQHVTLMYTTKEHTKTAAHFKAGEGGDDFTPTKTRWVTDCGATMHATTSAEGCTDIQQCRVQVFGLGEPFTCSQKGVKCLVVKNSETGETQLLKLQNVLISESFPANIVSEVVALEQNCYGTKSNKGTRWRRADGSWLYDALPGPGRLHYLVLAEPVAQGGSLKRKRSEAMFQATDTPAKAAKTILTAKQNLKLLQIGHLSLAHLSFPSVAKALNLTLPPELPPCIACDSAKPKYITHDKVAVKRATRRAMGFATDWKGPLQVESPEGFKGFFIFVCLFTGMLFYRPAKSQSEFEEIWFNMVAMIEAKEGREKVISFLIADNNKAVLATKS